LVDERAFAHARAADETVRLPRYQHPPQLVQPLLRHVTQGQHRRLDPGRPDLCPLRVHDLWRHQIGLRQQHARLGSALADHDQIALQPAEIEIVVARLHDDRAVHVGRDHLPLHRGTGRLAPQ